MDCIVHRILTAVHLRTWVKIGFYTQKKLIIRERTTLNARSRFKSLYIRGLEGHVDLIHMPF